ncbi:A-kinase anchor protein 13 isoform X3 [Pseudophryne corroboree]|uniref:A-kinase anchor protein 13 isoform X3 n=1 Tax=Pseudophryne corroboree TaxID=495146 RepID=UPI0030818F57
MKLNPQQAPLYGDCVLTVRLTEQSELEDDVVFYLLFAGSTLKHLTSTRKINSATLETVTPGHDCCERVKVSLCASKKGSSVVVAVDNFEFIQDEAYDSAQFLAANAGNQQALIFARFLDSSRPSPGDASILDEKITLAFRHLRLPNGWNVLGEEQERKDGHLQETLMHFAARLGLCRLSRFLLEQPGGKTALAIPNRGGATPISLALERGFWKLHQLLTEADPKKIDFPSEPSHGEHSGNFVLKHHCGLDVYTLTEKSQGEAHMNMESNIEQLKQYIQRHSDCLGSNVNTEQEPAFEVTADLCHQDVEKPDTDKPLDSQADLHSNSDCRDEPTVTPFREEGCLGDRVEELCLKYNSEVETVGVDVVSKSNDVDTKEEKEGKELIVEAQNTLVTNQQMQSCSTDAQAAETLLCGGNLNAETGMNSTGIVLDHKGLCMRDNTGEEMITATERTTADVALTEAPDKATDLTQHVSGEMGQAMYCYCTSAASAIETPCHAGNSEQETGLIAPLVNDSHPVDANSNHLSPEVLSLRLLAEAALCDVESGQPRGLGCSEKLDSKQSKLSEITAEDKSFKELADHLILTAGEKNPVMEVDKCIDSVLQLVKGSETQLPPVSENVITTAVSASQKESEVITSENAAVTQRDCTETSVSTDSKVQTDALSIPVSAEDTPHIHSAVVSPGATLGNVIGENRITTEIPINTCSENAQSTEPLLLPCQNEMENIDYETATDSLAGYNANKQTVHLPPIEPSMEACIAELIESIIQAALAVTANVQQQISGTGDQLPPAGQTEPLHKDKEIALCAEGTLNKDSDTPSLLNDHDCLKNQEVLTEESVLSNASTEMQEAAVTTTCQPNTLPGSELPLITDAIDGGRSLMHGETDNQALQEDIVSLPILDQCAKPNTGDGECSLQLEEQEVKLVKDPKEIATLDNLTEQKHSVGSVCEGDTKVMVEKETLETSPQDMLDTETLSVVACDKEEPEEVVKESNVEYDIGDDDSEVLKVSRASLHPIAEESLANGDSSSDTASTSSESSSALSDSEKSVGADDEDARKALDPFSHAVDCLCDDEEAAALDSALMGFNGALSMEESVTAVSGVMLSESAQPPSVQRSESFHNKEDYVQDAGDGSHVLKEEDSGLDLSVNLEETLCPSLSDTEIVSAESLDGKAEDEVDFVMRSHLSSCTQMINRESCCSITPCPHPGFFESKQPNDSKGCEQFLEDALDTEHSSPQTLKRESAGDTDMCYMPPEVLDEMVFTKLEEEQSLCDATSSGSDDTTSLERTSSHGSDISIPRNVKKHRERHSLDSSCSSTVTASVEERECENSIVSEVEGEEMDNITEVSPHTTRSKSAIRSLSPFRRHSWEPGKPSSNDAEINRRSSLRVLGDVIRKPTAHRRSYSLEGLAADVDNEKNPATTCNSSSAADSSKRTGRSTYEGEDRGSLISLTEEEQEPDQRKHRSKLETGGGNTHFRGFVYSGSVSAPHLSKSMSLTAIANPLVDIQGRTRPKRRISFSFSISPLIPKSKHVFSIGSSSSEDESDCSRSLNITSNSLALSISEEGCNHLPPSPSRKDSEGKGGTKVSRTFSYLKHKMSSSKKTKEKEKEKDKPKEKEKDPKEKDKDKKTVNGHLFSSTPVVGPITCSNCTKTFTNKDGYLCANCNSIVHKCCRESFTPCAKVKMKQQRVLQPHDTSSLPAVILRNKGPQPKERPRSAIVGADENTFTSLSFNSRRPQTALSISKSISTQNIAGIGCDENLLGTWKVLSQSTDSLHKISKVNESMESLIDEGTEMSEGQLMEEFETESRQLEAESWSQAVDSKFLKLQKKEVVKRQDVIYELMQTEMHHVRTLKIMSDVYSRGMLTELQFEQQVLEKIFPCMEDLLNIHTQFFQRILERKKESMAEKSEKNFVIKRIGDVLVHQFSGENAERMKKTYGKFCGHHNDAVNYFKDLLSKDKRFQAFIKKKRSSAVVRRLGIPECILLVTQRITKYPVLLQRILQYTKENEIEHQEVEQALNLVKHVITEVNNKVNNYEKKKRLNEIYNKTDSKSIQRMKSGQMFAKEDLKRRKLVRDGCVLLRSSSTSRSKEVMAVLMSDILVFLQEKDQKYMFASLEQKSTVISLKKLIVREVAHDEKGLFLISMGGKVPEMVEVLASSKDERNSWILTIQKTMGGIDKDEDEGVPSESEEEKRNWDTKARELKEQLTQKDEQIISLLEEKQKIFQTLTDCGTSEGNSSAVPGRSLFRANTAEAPLGESVVKNAIREVETLQVLVNRNLWSSVVQQVPSPTDLEPAVGPISLPRRAETFGGFDSHQLNASKSGEKEEGEDAQDLRRTESDGVLKKGVCPSGVFKRNGEQVLQSVASLHKLLTSLQIVVVQQDTFIEDQKLRALTRTSSRPNSLIEQEKHRNLEKQRQELAELQKQQAQHQEEKRRREREWEAREKELAQRETRLGQREETANKSLQELEQEKVELQNRKDEYQHDLERLRAAQKQLEKEREQLKKDMETVSEKGQKSDRKQILGQHDKLSRVSSLTVGTDSSAKWYNSSAPKQEHLESELSASPKKDSLLRTDSKQKVKGHFNLLGSQSNKSVEGPAPNRLFNLSKPKEKKEKKKKGKGSRSPTSDSFPVGGPTQEEEIFC